MNIKFAEYCKCGASFSGIGKKDKVLLLINTWWQSHQGDGHGRATPRECYLSRGRAIKSVSLYDC